MRRRLIGNLTLVVCWLFATVQVASNDLPGRATTSGFKAWIDGDIAGAADHFRLATDKEGLHNLAAAVFEHSGPTAADALTASLHRKYPRWLPATLLHGRVQRARGGASAITTALELASARRSSSHDRLWAGAVLAEAGDLPRAVSVLMQAVSSEPDLYQAWLALGDAHAAGGATHQAVIAWNRAASLCRTAEVLQRLGRAAIAAGRHQDARRLFTQALESPGGESLVAEVSRLMPEVVDVGAVWHNGRPAPRWHPGEVLRYAVRLLGVPLGRVELTTTFREGPDGHPAYALGMTAETHPGYFFFRVRNRYESLVSEDGVFLHHSSHENDSRAKPSMAAYDVDRLRRVCTWRYVEDGLVGIERLPLLPLGQDGLSILALAREAARTGRSCSAPTIASGSWKGTDIEVRGTEQLRWAGRDVSVVRVDVVAHFRGAAGLSGASTTWYTKDDRTLPLKSSVKLPVGSITLELLDR